MSKIEEAAGLIGKKVERIGITLYDGFCVIEWIEFMGGERLKIKPDMGGPDISEFYKDEDNEEVEKCE